MINSHIGSAPNEKRIQVAGQIESLQRQGYIPALFWTPNPSHAVGGALTRA
jgi:hypothetical protein